MKNFKLIFGIAVLAFLVGSFVEQIGRLPNAEYCNTPHSWWQGLLACCILIGLFWCGYDAGVEQTKNKL